jgi:hypothetical protein
VQGRQDAEAGALVTASPALARCAAGAAHLLIIVAVEGQITILSIPWYPASLLLLLLLLPVDVTYHIS